MQASAAIALVVPGACGVVHVRQFLRSLIHTRGEALLLRDHQIVVTWVRLAIVAAGDARLDLRLDGGAAASKHGTFGISSGTESGVRASRNATSCESAKKRERRRRRPA